MNSPLSLQLQNRLPTVLGGVTLLLVVFNGALVVANRSTQAQVTARAQYINQSLQLDRVLQAIVRAAATAAINNKDTRLDDVLKANGIRYQVGTPTAIAPAPTQPAANAPVTPTARAAGPTTGPAAAQTPKGGR